MKTPHLIILTFGLLFAIGCTNTKHPSSGNSKPPVRASTPLSGVLLISAVYGSGSSFVDVTHRVNELLNQPGVEFFARPEWLKADPTPGWNKSLVIVYDLKGQRQVLTRGEGSRVSLELLKNPPTQTKKAKKK